METKTYQRTNFWIIKIIVPAFNYTELYLLFLTGDKDVPLTLDSKIAIFQKDAFLHLLKKIGFIFTEDQLTTETDLIYDPEKVMILVRDKSIDMKAVIINSINILLDMLYALNMEMPKEYKTAFYSFADHLTFSRRYGGFLKKEKIARSEITNAFYWLNGVLVSNSMLDPDVRFDN